MKQRGYCEKYRNSKKAISYLINGGCVGIFPGGTVSTSLKPFGRAMDPSWRKFTARLISKSGASVIQFISKVVTAEFFKSPVICITI